MATNAVGFNGYVYRDRGANGPCKALLARPRERVRAVCSGRSGSIPFSLDEPSQGTLVVSISFGTASRQCATFGGRISRDFGTGSGDNGLFKAADADPVLGAACP